MQMSAASGIDSACAQRWVGNYVMAGGVVEFDALRLAAYPADIVGVVLDTPSALSNAERATVGVPGSRRRAHSHSQHAAPMFDPGPTSDQQQSCGGNARRIDPR
jgi:hypothetical protein